MRRVRVLYVDMIVGLLVAIMVDGDAIYFDVNLVVNNSGRNALWSKVVFPSASAFRDRKTAVMNCCV
jgi:hypothetical protein